ncbi:MAG: rod shape-determining protein MreC [Arcobacteraceae bacterium]|jgi:rod shape-determining protein MreC|nr:rod shape-determining protein MreC [Arcobacteraceae bacterium]
MNKNIVFLGLMILVLLGYIFNFDKLMSNSFIGATSDIRWSYSSSITIIKDTINSYFNQAQTLENFATQRDKNTHYKILYERAQNELNNLKQDMQIMDSNLSYGTIYAKAVSYINLNDFSKVILDKQLPAGKLYPLLTPQGFSAGIVRVYNNLTIGYLNTNEKSNYAVFIGDTNAPGITSGADENGYILIQHIPKWYGIKVNDEVVTSGMDEIFPYGVKVGRVVGTKDLLNTKMAIVKPYAFVTSKRYFYIITKTTNVNEM